MITVITLAASLLVAPSSIVPCGSDADCAVKNPGVSTYGTPAGWVRVDGPAGIELDGTN